MKIPPSDGISALLLGVKSAAVNGLMNRRRRRRNAGDSDDSCSRSSIASAYSASCSGHNSSSQEWEEDSNSSTSSSNTIVSFQETDNILHENTLYAHEDCKYLWYSQEELGQFKSAASFMAKMIHQAEAGRDPLCYTGILEQAYKSCCEETDTTIDDAQVVEALLPTKVQTRFRNLFLVEIGIGRLGLERRSMRLASQDKSRRRHLLLEMVNYLDNNVDDLRQSCEQVSLASRRFAQHLAEAQWEATAC